MVELPRVILAATVHEPCQRAAETGGMAVRTVSTEDGAERLPPRSAATRYWYGVSGARPVVLYDVTVPETEPTTSPLDRIRYLSGSGPVAGFDQWNVTEPVVSGPAVSPVGRSSGGLFQGAQITRPVIRPTTTRSAIPAGTAQPRRLRRGVGGAPAGAIGPRPPGSGGTPAASAGCTGENPAAGCAGVNPAVCCGVGEKPAVGCGVGVTSAAGCAGVNPAAGCGDGV